MADKNCQVAIPVSIAWHYQFVPKSSVADIERGLLLGKVSVPQVDVPLPWLAESGDRMLVPHGTRSHLLFLLLNLLGLPTRFMHRNSFLSQPLSSDSPEEPTFRRSNDVRDRGRW